MQLRLDDREAFIRTERADRIEEREGKHCVIGESGTLFGCYDSHEQAEERLAQIKRFAEDGEDAVRRFDVTRIDASRVQRTPQGGIRVPARVTRSGVFVYRRADGSQIREYRPPEEVFSQDSLASLEDAPVTRRHPSSLVDGKSYRQVTIGHVRPGPRQDGQYVEADLVVQDADAVRDIEAGKLLEVSCGYGVRVDAQPGRSPEGQRYDAVQRGITYNHAALGPKGWGRAGRDVALRLDAGDAIQDDDDPAPTPKPDPKDVRKDAMETIRIDGVEYKLDGSATARQAIEKAIADRDARIDALEQEKRDEVAAVTKERDEIKSAKDELQGKHDALEKERDELKGKLDAAENPERLDEMVKARADLLTKAQRLAPQAKLDGLGDREVMAEALKAAKVEVKEDHSDDYVRARFDAEIERLPQDGGKPRTDAAGVRQAARQAQTQPGGGGETRADARTARQKMLEHHAELGREPLHPRDRAPQAQS